MKKMLCVFIFVSVFLVSCSNEEPLISPDEFASQLHGFDLNYSAQTLTEISTGLIGNTYYDFRESENWARSENAAGREMYVMLATLNDEVVRVEVSFEDTKVYEVKFIYEFPHLESFSNYIKFSLIADITDIAVAYGDEDLMTNVEEDAMIEMFNTAVVNDERVALFIDFDYTNNIDRESHIEFSYFYSPTIIGNIISSEITFT